MRRLEAVFDNRPDLAGNRRGSPKRNEKSVEPLLDAEVRHWPVVPLPQRNDMSALEDKIARQSEELNLRCTQVADLYNTQQRQANELQVACEEIDRLSGTISTLLDQTTQQEAVAEATKKQIALLETEKAALRAELEMTRAEFRDVSQRLLAVETAFNDRETTLASALEKINSLNSELIAASADTFKIVAVTTGEKQRYRSELNQQKASFEGRIKALESTAATQDAQIRESRRSAHQIGKAC